MDILRNIEATVVCPYNNSHHIHKNRIEMHLLRCRKQYKGPQEMVMCDFNASHVIPKIELQYHHNECPDRKSVELQLFQEKTDFPLFKPPVPATTVPIDTSWDDDEEVASYDPQKYCEANAVLRRLDGASKAVRKNFQLQERRRFNEIRAKQEKSLPSKTMQATTTASSAQQRLPETPKFLESNIEDPPEDIAQLKQLLDRLPTKAVIPKPRRNE